MIRLSVDSSSTSLVSETIVLAQNAQLSHNIIVVRCRHQSPLSLPLSIVVADLSFLFLKETLKNQFLRERCVFLFPFSFKICKVGRDSV